MVASQDLGPRGPRDGPAIPVACPLGDSLRSVAGWFVLLLLLAVRKANRNLPAWAVLLPLLMIYGLLAVTERLLNGYLIFHYHQYICSSLGDLLRYFSLGVALLLVVADCLTIPWRWLRFLVVLLLLFLISDVHIALNAWPFLNSSVWASIFGVMLFLFMVGHSLVHAVLRRLICSDRFRWWYGGFCLVFGLLPLLILGAVEWHLSRSIQLQSTQEVYRVVVVLASAVTLPYFVFFCFLLLAARNSLYSQRLAQAFGVTGLCPEAKPSEAAGLQAQAEPRMDTNRHQ